MALDADRVLDAGGLGGSTQHSRREYEQRGTEHVENDMKALDDKVSDSKNSTDRFLL